jgi:hypothetical protein
VGPDAVARMRERFAVARRDPEMNRAVRVRATPYLWRCALTARSRRLTAAPAVARTRECSRAPRSARRARTRRSATARDDGGGEGGEPEPGRARPDLRAGVVA